VAVKVAASGAVASRSTLLIILHFGRQHRQLADRTSMPDSAATLVALIDEPLHGGCSRRWDYLQKRRMPKPSPGSTAQSRIAVPAIYRHATSRRVLTMEWTDGVKLTNLKGRLSPRIDP